MDMYLYDKFVQDSKINAPDMEIQKESKRLSKENQLIYDDKKKLQETGPGSPFSQLFIIAAFSIASFVIFPVIYLLFPAFAVIIIFFIEALIVGCSFPLANFLKFRNSPLVNKSLYNKLFIGGTNTRWYNYVCTMDYNAVMDLDDDNNVCPTNKYYMIFISTENYDLSNSHFIELTQEEYNMFCSYDFNMASVAVCDNDVVDVLFYLRKENGEIASPTKISEK